MFYTLFRIHAAFNLQLISTIDYPSLVVSAIFFLFLKIDRYTFIDREDTDIQCPNNTYFIKTCSFSSLPRFKKLFFFMIDSLSLCIKTFLLSTAKISDLICTTLNRNSDSIEFFKLVLYIS